MKRLMLMLVALCAFAVPAKADPPLIFHFVGNDNRNHYVITLVPDGLTFQQYSDLVDFHLVKCLVEIEIYL